MFRSRRTGVDRQSVMAYTKHLTDNALLSGGEGDGPIYYITDSSDTEVWWAVTEEEADKWIDEHS